MSAAGAPRGEAVAAIADAIEGVSCPHPVRVAIDGSPAAGKTTLAAELAVALRGRGREVISASIEEFLHPQITRYRKGTESSQGCYEDSFDLDRLQVELLRPLGASGSRRYRTQIYDRRTDSPADSDQVEAAADAILLFDGVFLLRPELVSAWDFCVLITVAVEEIIRRGRNRDGGLYGSADLAEQRYRARYLPAQRHYFGTVRPRNLADIVLENDDPARPRVASSESARRERARCARSL